MTRFFKLIFACLTAICVGIAPAVAQQASGFEPKAPQIYLVEASTNTVLYARGENDPIPPASLVKLMTAEYVLHQIKAGAITDNTEYKVSEYAWRTGGALSRTKLSLPLPITRPIARMAIAAVPKAGTAHIFTGRSRSRHHCFRSCCSASLARVSR